jgi:hypothetical protein
MSVFDSFHAYDDEGYFLVLLRDYMSGRPLLTPNIPVYGPFFFEVMGGLFKLLGLQSGHDSGRYVTLAIWLITSLIAGLAARRLTRSLWLGLGAQLVTFMVLDALVSEPMSPSGLVSLLLVSLVAAATFRSSRPRAAAVLIGAIVGALCLVKINVGGFAAIAVAFAWAGSLPHRWRRFALPLMALLITALPFVIMAALLSRLWVLEFAVLVSFSAAAVGLACVGSGPQRPSPPAAIWMAAGGLVIVIASLGIALAGGTTANDLWNGLVVVSVRFPQVFELPFPIDAAYDLWASLALAAALAVFALHASSRVPRIAAAVVRVGAGFSMWVSMTLLPAPIFLLTLPLAWVATQAPGDRVDDPASDYCRLLLPALAVLESLQVYPVAGTQLALAAVALVPVLAICISDGIRQFRTELLPARAKFTVRAVAVAMAINVFVFLLFAIGSVGGYRPAVNLGLPGAASVRLSVKQTTQLRALVAAIDRDCSSFMTLPGMNSFYLWTGQEPPTDIRGEVWWLTLANADQQSIVRQLEPRPRLCVVKNQKLVDFWAQGRQVPNRALVNYIDQSFVDDGSYGDYQLLIRQGS